MTQDNMARLQKRVFEVFQEEIPRIMQGLIQGMVDPSQLMGIFRHFGLDPSRLQSMMAGQPAFDPYAVLGLDKSATDEEVKKRYRELMFILHPDASKTEATTFMFRLAQMAYEMITRERGWQ